MKELSIILLFKKINKDKGIILLNEILSHVIIYLSCIPAVIFKLIVSASITQRDLFNKLD
jgi:hypothetical protein